MDEDINEQIAQVAAQVVETCTPEDSVRLDYSEASLAVLDAIIEDASDFFDEMTTEQQETLVENFGCYLLEVARREFGGEYQWFEQRDQPVLVVERSDFRAALIAWDKVQGRLAGDPADNIPFFYSGFAECVRNAQPGTDVMYV